MAAPLGQDTFIRANQSGFGTASDGQVWVKTGPGTASIASNEGLLISNGNDTHVQLGSIVTGSMEVLCRIAINNVNDICGIQARFTAGGGNTTTYKFLFYTGAVHLNRSVGGFNAQLTSVSFTMTPGTFYWFRHRVQDSNLSGKIWQSGNAEPADWTTTTTDTNVTGVGGFAVLANTDPSSTGIKFDSFQAIPLTSTLTILPTVGQATSTLSTASALFTTDGGNENYFQSPLAQSTTGYGQLIPIGTSNPWPALGSIGDPDGRGWLWDSSQLANQQIAAGNWSGLLTLSIDSGSVLVDVYLRVFHRTSAGIYTRIVTLTATSQTITTSDLDVSFAAVSASAWTFSSTDKLYADLWVNIRTNSIGAPGQSLYIATSSTANKGNSAHGRMVTPGYAYQSAAPSTQQTFDTFLTLGNWISLAASDGSCAVRSDLSNSYNCQTGYFAAGAYQNTNALALNGGIVGHADVLSGQKHGWQIHSVPNYSIPGIFAARLDITGDTGGDGTYEKIVKSFFLLNDPGDTVAYMKQSFDFVLEANNTLLDSYPGQATPAVLNTTTYGGSGSGFPNSQLAPTYLDSSLFGDFITCIMKVEFVSGTSSKVWKTTYQIVNVRGATITLGSTTTTHDGGIASVGVWFDEHWLDPTGGQQTNYNWQRMDLRWFYYSADVTDQTPYSLGDTVPTGGRHVGFDFIGNGFSSVPGLSGILGEVALDATSGTSTSVAVLDIYQRTAQITTLSLAYEAYAFLLIAGGAIVTDTAVNIDQVGGTTVTSANLPVNIVQVGGATAAMGSADAQTAGNVPLYVVGVYNGTTVDRLRSGLGDAVATTGLPGLEIHVYNGSTYDRARSAAVGDAAAATGIPANQPMVYNGSTYDRVREVSGDAVAASGIAANQPMLYNGTTYDRWRTAQGDAASTGLADIAGYLYNGTNFDRTRNNLDNITVLASAARTTTQTQADQTNYNQRGIVAVLDMTTVGTGSVTLEIDGKDPVSGKYYAILTGAAVTTVSTNTYTVYPGNTVTANVSASTVLPRTWRIKVTHNNANSCTYSVGAMLIL